ncbi:hypothetical protein AB7179_03210 [Providencia manganoxydans]|uniref:hypothetical protein n=1 Tax=Providencia manganoxydans TaxID=2923283 RepID=UPI0034E48D09
MINNFLEEISNLSIQHISKNKFNTIIENLNAKLKGIKSKEKVKLLDESIILLMDSIKEEKTRSAIGFYDLYFMGDLKTQLMKSKKKVHFVHQNTIIKQKR